MTRAERGLFTDMIAIAWDSEEPGTVDMDLQDFAKVLGILPKVLRKFLVKFPKTFCKFNGKFRQPKLHSQWLSYCEIREKRVMAANSKYAHAQQVDSSASASAFASATAKSKDKAPQNQRRSIPPISREERQRRFEEMTYRERKEDESRREARVGANPFSDAMAEIARKKAL